MKNKFPTGEVIQESNQAAMAALQDYLAADECSIAAIQAGVSSLQSAVTEPSKG